MGTLARVSAVEHLGGRTLRVTFSDGLVRELDFTGALPGALSEVDDDVIFATVEVDPVARTVSWLDRVDLDPDVLHGDDEAASTPGPRVVREFRLQQTH